MHGLYVVLVIARRTPDGYPTGACKTDLMASKATMARLIYGRLSEAWLGEAKDFTPLLAEQLDLIGEAMGVDLASAGQYEVPSAGGRRIDIVAAGADGSEFVIENQYGRADHDHLTRGPAYAVARRARGLVVVAEEHRDEFRAVAQYLNDLAESDPERGIAVWLIEARAVRIGDSPWAPLFTSVVEPNAFTTVVEQDRQTSREGKEQQFWESFTAPGTRIHRADPDPLARRRTPTPVRTHSSRPRSCRARS
jgi:hypothetical protein